MVSTELTYFDLLFFTPRRLCPLNQRLFLAVL